MPSLTRDTAPALDAVERAAVALGRSLYAAAAAQSPTPLSRRWWDAKLMGLTMGDESVKLQMLRLVDVLPMLKSERSIDVHLQEYLGSVRDRLPTPVRWVIDAARPDSWSGGIVARLARDNAQGQARRFIAGSDAAEVLAAARRERSLGRAFTLDVLGEAVVSDREADRYLQAYLDLFENVAPVVNAWGYSPSIDGSGRNRVPRMNVSIKLSALDAHYDAVDPDGSFARVAPRLRTLLRAARKAHAFVNFDMESYETKNLTHEIFRRILAEPEFVDFADVGIVVQCYLRDAYDDLTRLHEWARKRGAPIWVRLVKGAYWDYETILAQQRGWPVPVFQQKWESDANYERCTRYALDAHPWIVTALGSHNLRSIAYGLAYAKAIGLPNDALEIQMLYGMADEEKQALVDEGRRVRVYMPYGELIPGMAYLVRRLLENTSNDSFLKAGFADRAPLEELLMNPLDVGARKSRRDDATNGTAVASSGSNGRSHGAPHPHLSRPEFRNEPPADFSRAETREALEAALARAAKAGPRSVPLFVDGRVATTDRRFASHNPSRKDEVVGEASFASKEHVEQAVAAAKKALPGWSRASVTERANVLRRIAAELRSRRFDLAALIVRETGKPWREADGDVCEAIDFCEFYALQAENLFGDPHGVDVAGEQNRFTFAPRGVTAVIAPWNFPLAILTGMATAALVSGNTVCVKPAEQSPVVAGALSEIIQGLGLPPGVFNFLPGDGPTTGAALVEHPDVAMTIFTGSRAVGLAINAKAAEVSARATRPLVKRVVAEMGGKNAIIIDDDADLDEAVVGVAHSAFGYAGQKCSACSRVIVLEGVYDAFVERLVEAARALPVEPADRPGAVVGPVIDEAAFERVHEYVALGKREGREALAVDVGALANEGWFVGPHIFADVAPTARLAQEEVFGPVLAVIKAKDLDEAFAIANGVDYALTAGLYSRSPTNLERARRELEAGNVYLNRGITGALVNRQPFGGYKLSGIGSKAGGADYLLQFVVPRTITENTMRRGFAPPAAAGE